MTRAEMEIAESGVAFLKLPTPMEPLDALRRLARLPFSATFLSHGPADDRGRFSYVMADPVRTLFYQNGKPRIGKGIDLADQSQDPWEALAREVKCCKQASIPGLPPFQGGWAGMLAYDLVHWLEKIPRPDNEEFSTPEMVAGLYDVVLATDRLSGDQWLISTGLGVDPEKIDPRQRAKERLSAFLRILAADPLPWDYRFSSGPPVRPERLREVPGQSAVYSHFSRDEYLRALGKTIEYILAGDCFQVNLAQRLLHRDMPPLALLGKIAGKNPVPFACWLDWGEGQLVSASPERFMRLDQNKVSTRPIKGTRARGKNPVDDMRLWSDLAHSDKDRAENVMIVDLLRNDLGRSCVPGSIEVPSVCQIESFPTVHHMVSEVRGLLRPDLGPVELLARAFPGGSVTGAPKVRAMEIISELEGTRRGAYCGSFFWISADGGMDSSILIRTITREGGWLAFPVGGGIVADSNPADEYAETLHKAEGVIRLIEAV